MFVGGRELLDRLLTRTQPWRHRTSRTDPLLCSHVLNRIAFVSWWRPTRILLDTGPPPGDRATCDGPPMKATIGPHAQVSHRTRTRFRRRPTAPFPITYKQISPSANQSTGLNDAWSHRNANRCRHSEAARSLSAMTTMYTALLFPSIDGLDGATDFEHCQFAPFTGSGAK